MTPREIAQAMIADFKANGRAIGIFTNASGQKCMASAALQAAKIKTNATYFMSYEDQEKAEELAKALGFEDLSDMCVFNNTHTDEQVIARLESVQ